MSTYVLPDLPYDCSALEPFVSGQLLELHHDKHHAAYVKGANVAREALEELHAKQGAPADDAANAPVDAGRISQLTRDLAFNLAGHVNHSLFWENLSPAGGGIPTGEFAQVIDEGFGSLAGFKSQFGAMASSVQGSGWAMLAIEPLSGKLGIFQLHDHQSEHPAGCAPLLLLDMWEHAYYLDYHNDKAAYVRAFWDVVDWERVAERYAAARA